jgi:hypothetical protein
MSKAITPQEVIEKQKSIVTDWMIEIINGMLTKKWDGCKAVITKERIKEVLSSKGYNYETFRENGGLKFEPIYREQGWHVDETEDFWIFTVIKGR